MTLTPTDPVKPCTVTNGMTSSINPSGPWSRVITALKLLLPPTAPFDVEVTTSTAVDNGNNSAPPHHHSPFPS